MRKTVKFFIITCILLFILPVTAHADTGPKPSVVIDIEGLEDETYYVTLLSEKDSTGPWSAGDDYYEYFGDKTAFDMFSQYEDKDGYYFLSFMQDCSDTDQFAWTYYPPQLFKILIYYPDKDIFQVSDNIYERYAFDSYFKLVVEDEADNFAYNLILKKNYNYIKEAVSLVVRIVITLSVEILLALLFGYRDRKNLKVIMIANLFTQILLNLLLNIINYKSGFYNFVFNYVWMELVVLIIEAGIYIRFTDKRNPTTRRKMHPVFYAVTANFASLVIGILLAGIIPSVF